MSQRRLLDIGGSRRETAALRAGSKKKESVHRGAIGLSRPTILALSNASAQHGLAAVTGIRKQQRRGSVLTPELEKKLVDTTVKTRPGNGSTHRSVRILAKQLRISRTIVHRVWQRHDMQPHRVLKFKLSNDPHFEEKVMSLACIHIRPNVRWYRAWMKRARFKLGTALLPFRLCAQACRSVKRAIINAMAQAPRGLRPGAYQ